MMMVSMMMSADGSQTMPQFGMQGQMNGAMNPFMMPQQIMAPAAQAGTQQEGTANYELSAPCRKSRCSCVLALPVDRWSAPEEKLLHRTRWRVDVLGWVDVLG
jgi:hypothetical protein